MKSRGWKFILGLYCLLLLASCQSANPPQGLVVKVARVLSGQSLEVTGTGEESAARAMRVRLVGIEAPSLQQQPWGRAAKDRLEKMIGGQSVWLEFDLQAKDSFGRSLAYVWKDGVLLNEKLVAEGCVLSVPQASPNHKYDQRLEHAQEWARLMGQGIWNPEQPMRLTPAEFRRQNH